MKKKIFNEKCIENGLECLQIDSDCRAFLSTYFNKKTYRSFDCIVDTEDGKNRVYLSKKVSKRKTDKYISVEFLYDYNDLDSITLKHFNKESTKTIIMYFKNNLPVKVDAYDEYNSTSTYANNAMNFIREYNKTKYYNEATELYYELTKKKYIVNAEISDYYEKEYIKDLDNNDIYAHTKSLFDNEDIYHYYENTDCVDLDETNNVLGTYIDEMEYIMNKDRIIHERNKQRRR